MNQHPDTSEKNIGMDGTAWFCCTGNPLGWHYWRSDVDGKELRVGWKKGNFRFDECFHKWEWMWLWLPNCLWSPDWAELCSVSSGVRAVTGNVLKYFTKNWGEEGKQTQLSKTDFSSMLKNQYLKSIAIFNYNYNL